MTNDEFDYKALAVLCSWWIYLLHNRRQNGVPVTADSLTVWRVNSDAQNIDDVTAALLHKPQQGALAVPARFLRE